MAASEILSEGEITEEQGENLLGENRYFYDFKKHVPLNLNFFTKREVAL